MSSSLSSLYDLAEVFCQKCLLSQRHPDTLCFCPRGNPVEKLLLTENHPQYHHHPEGRAPKNSGKILAFWPHPFPVCPFSDNDFLGQIFNFLGPFPIILFVKNKSHCFWLLLNCHQFVSFCFVLNCFWCLLNCHHHQLSALSGRKSLNKSVSKICWSFSSAKTDLV